MRQSKVEFTRWSHKHIRSVMGTILDDIQHLPHGYSFWFNLSKRKQQSITRKWILLLHDRLFPQYIKDHLVVVLLSPQGVPHKETAPLYDWVVDVIYHGSEVELYQQWLIAKRRISTDADS